MSDALIAPRSGDRQEKISPTDLADMRQRALRHVQVVTATQLEARRQALLVEFGIAAVAREAADRHVLNVLRRLDEVRKQIAMGRAEG